MTRIEVEITDEMEQRIDKLVKSLGYWGTRAEFIREALRLNIQRFEPMLPTKVRK